MSVEDSFCALLLGLIDKSTRKIIFYIFPHTESRKYSHGSMKMIIPLKFLSLKISDYENFAMPLLKI